MSHNGTWQWLLEGFKYELETQVKPKTVEYYLDHAKTFARWARDVAAIEAPHLITKRDLQAFFHYLTATPAVVTKGNGAIRHIQRTDRTRWHYYKGLRRFFSWLEAEGLVNDNPISTMKLAEPPPVPIEPYSPEHVATMLKVLDHNWKMAATPRQKMLAARDRAVLLLFLESGLRLSELASLRLQDVDLDRQRVLVRNGKLGKGRVAGFGEETKRAVWRYLTLRQGSGDALWLTEEGNPIAVHGIQQVIRRLKAEAGLAHLTGAVHKLRHTFATTYLKHTRDMKGCRLLLGHSTLAMVERYTQFIEAEDALDAYTAQGPLRWLMDTAGRSAPAARRC